AILQSPPVLSAGPGDPHSWRTPLPSARVRERGAVSPPRTRAPGDHPAAWFRTCTTDIPWLGACALLAPTLPAGRVRRHRPYDIQIPTHSARRWRVRRA